MNIVEVKVHTVWHMALFDTKRHYVIYVLEKKNYDYEFIKL